MSLVPDVHLGLPWPEVTVFEGVPLKETLNWIDLNTPLTREVLARLDGVRLDGLTLAYAGHVEPKMLSHIEALKRAGVGLTVTPCVPGIAHPASFAHLRDLGVTTRGERARTWDELGAAWDEALAERPDFLFDIGGGLIQRAVERRAPVRAACEATSTGVAVVRALSPHFPIFNWNDVPVKTLMHNRYEVGSGVWYAFRNLTGLDLCRLRVGVIGYGLVGQSVAATARGLGAQVFVAERDPLRELTASSDGFVTLTGEDLAGVVDVLITATGRRATVDARLLALAKDGLLIANAGHDGRDVDLSGLTRVDDVLPNVTRFTRGTKKVFLLCEGRLLNLAAGGGSAVNTFDLVTALITNVIAFVMTEGPRAAPGVHNLPAHVSEGLVRAAAANARYRSHSSTSGV